MTDSPPSPVSIAPPGDASATLRAVETWLDQPDRPGLLEEVPALVSLLSRLRSCHADRQSRNIALSRMGGRIIENSEKLLAALRGGIETVLIPAENEKDLVEIPDNVKNGLEIIPVRWIDDVLTRALTRLPEPLEESAPVPAAIAGSASGENSVGALGSSCH